MPELPEVETFARSIAGGVGGEALVSSTSSGLRYVKESVCEVEDIAPGTVIEGYRRHGKALFLKLSSGRWLYIHFGMSGRPLVFDGDEPPYTRLRLDFEGRSLSVQDPRRLGGVGVLDSPEDYLLPRRRGPDALSVGREELLSRLKGGRAVKAALMDQSLIAGVGNLYADEVLFQAAVLPRRRVDSLHEEERAAVHEWIGRALRASLDAGTDLSRLPEGMMLRVRSKDGTCPRCLIPWSVGTVGGRTSYFCEGCQR